MSDGSGFDENIAREMADGALGSWAEKEAEQDRILDQMFAQPNEENHYRAAARFLEACGLDPNPDALEQLIDGFLPALRLVCGRPHSPDGSTWRKAGWRAQLYEMLKKAERMRYRSWERAIPDMDSAVDMINYAAFYIRGINDGLTPWGEWGEPGSQRGIEERPTVVCICGSGKFSDTIFEVSEQQTLLGKIVLRPDVNVKNVEVDKRSKEALDKLHLRKIDMADQVIVVSLNGYIGESTRAEIDYAMSSGKEIIFLEGRAEKNYHSNSASPTGLTRE